jgi:hypothetical protein
MRLQLLSAAVSLLIGSAVAAADLGKPAAAPAADQSQVCYENSLPADVFGFNTGSDVNDVGAKSGSLQYVGSFATRTGNYNGHGVQAQFAYGLARCIEIGPFLYGSAARNGGVLGIGSGTQFGGGIEFKYKFLGRDVHGIGATFDAAFQGTGLDGNLYAPAKSSYDGSVALFLDKELMKDKLYGAVNIGYSWNWFDKVPGGYATTSVLRVGAALSYQVDPGLFIGAEINHFRRYNSAFMAKELGNATYLGPNFFWQRPGSNLAISGAYGYQLGGKAKGSGNRLDLTNFSQHTAKLKAAYAF